MQTATIGRKAGALALALALCAGLWVATAEEARADQDHLGGVTIDAKGVHFDFGRGHHYLSVDYPDARRHFVTNVHYVKAKRLENERDESLERLNRQLSRGRLERAERSFKRAFRLEQRRQRQLAKLEEDRARYELKHARAHHRGYRHWARNRH